MTERLSGGENIYRLFFEKAIADLKELRDRIILCKKCLSVPGDDVRKVIGSGFPLADIFLLKSDFTSDELESGISFYGRDGEIISKSCSALENIRFDFIYGTASHKCYMENLDITGFDCSDIVSVELRTVRPRIIVAMGSTAFNTLKKAGYANWDQVYSPGTLIKSNQESFILATYEISEALGSGEIKKAFWSHLRLLDKGYKRMLTLFDKNNPFK